MIEGEIEGDLVCSVATAFNHLASCVSDLPEYVAKNRNISAVKMAPASGIRRDDGSIHTGFFPNWKSLSKEERGQVTAERMKKKGGKKTGGQGSIKTELQSLKKKLGKNKRKIAALKSQVAEKRGGGDGDDDSDSADAADAGDSFGGKRKKKKE